MAKRLLLKKNNEILENLSREIPENGIISVGSDNSAVLCLDDASIAPEQFIIISEDGKLTLLNRASGTFFNGTPLAPGALQEINVRDEIRAGSFSMIPESKNGFVPPEAPDFFSANETAAQNEKPNENLPEDNPDLHITMNDVLENLRSDEKFYFLIDDKISGKRRVYVEFEEMWIGWAADNYCVISENPADIQTPRAQIRKDWSGVVLFPNIPQTVRVNEEVLNEPYRLKNDDHLFLQPATEAVPVVPTSIKFHEPTALLVLDSILPKELPPPVSIPRIGKKRRRPADTAKVNGQAQSLTVKAPPPVIPQSQPGRIFGYFTLIEIVIMAVGTLIAAAMIFLVLELF